MGPGAAGGDVPSASVSSFFWSATCDDFGIRIEPLEGRGPGVSVVPLVLFGVFKGNFWGGNL